LKDIATMDDTGVKFRTDALANSNDVIIRQTNILDIDKCTRTFNNKNTIVQINAFYE